MKLLLRSLARNESTVVSKQTLLKDISLENENLLQSRNTIEDYLDLLLRLNIIYTQSPYSENYRSQKRVGKSVKRYFIDTSLACTCLNLTTEKLMNDLRTFGLMFKSLVQRDLKIYMEYLNGNTYHFRDNTTGLKVDSILEFENGEYAMVEIKLGFNSVEVAKQNLVKLYKGMIKKPKFMCIIVGYTDVIAKDPETGIYIVPITALKP